MEELEDFAGFFCDRCRVSGFTEYGVCFEMFRETGFGCERCKKDEEQVESSRDSGSGGEPQ